MAYATQQDYIDWLQGRLGIIPLTEFPFWASRASEEIDAITFGRAKSVEDTEVLELVIKATCEYAEHLFVTFEQRGVVSVSVTGHSITYDKSGRDKQSILRRLLGETGLLYKGALV